MHLFDWLGDSMAVYIAIFGIALFVPALLMVAGHYFPWRPLIGRDLHPNAARIYGVGVIGAIFSVLIFWLPDLTAPWVIALLWTCIVSAGGATVAVWILDALIAAQATVASKTAQVGALERVVQSS